MLHYIDTLYIIKKNIYTQLKIISKIFQIYL